MRTAIRAHWARIRVLFTMLVSLAILFTLIYLLSGGGLFQSRAIVKTYFEDAGGVEDDAEVDFNGVKIGKVYAVRLSHLNDPHQTVEVEMQVYRRFLSQMPNDSRCEIQSANVLGSKFIEITRGRSPVPVQDGGVLEHVPATNVYVRVDLTNFAATLRTIDATLKEIQDGKGSMGEFFMTDDLYRELLTGVTSIQHDVDAAVNTKSPVGQLLYTPKMYESTMSSVHRLDASLAEIQAGRGATGEFLRRAEMHENLRKNLADLRASMQKIGNSSFITSDAQYKEWNRTLADLSKAVDDFNAGRGAGQLLVNSQIYESLVGSMKELEGDLRDFRTNPRKYLRLKIF